MGPGSVRKLNDDSISGFIQQIMSKLLSMSEAVAQFVPDGSSVAMSLQLEQMIPFAAAHEIIRQKKRNLTLIGPISDVLFDQLIGAGCVERVIAAWAKVLHAVPNSRLLLKSPTLEEPIVQQRLRDSDSLLHAS